MSKCKSKARFSVANDARKSERKKKRKKEKKKERKKEKATVRNLMRDIFVVIIEAKSATHIHTGFTKRKDTKKYTRKQSER